MAKCMLCGKGPVSGNNVPKSQHKTHRRVQPNVQKVDGLDVCTRCLRTIKRGPRVRKVEAAAPVAA